MDYRVVRLRGLLFAIVLWLILLPSVIQAQPVSTTRVIVALNTFFDAQAFASTAFAQQQGIQSAQQSVIASLSSYNIRVNAAYQNIPYLALSADDEALEYLRQSNLVSGIYPEIPLRFSLAESGPRIGAPAAHAAGYDGAGQTIVVIDTGVDRQHPFFGGRIIHEACFSSSDGDSTFSLCPNGQSTQFGAGAGDACSIGGCYHGTHVAGIAAGDGSTFDGIAPAANIISIQIAHGENNLLACMSFEACAIPGVGDLLSALDYVYTIRNSYTIAAVNMSLGGGKFTSQCDTAEPHFRDIFALLRAAGIAPIAGTGNDSYTDGISIPACVSNVISVGATSDVADTVASYSNSMSGVDLLAPGSNITSSMPGGSFASLDGTSMATPHVAGAWAVLRDAKPSASIEEILAALQHTGPLVTDSRNSVRAPRIQVDAAANALVAGTVPTVGAVYINEVQMHGTQAVELYNFGASAVNLTGWRLASYGTGGAVERDYTIPTFTLNAGAYVTLLRGTGTDTATMLYMGNYTTTWASGGAALLRNGNVGIDFVRWSSSTLVPPLATGFTGTTPALPSTGRTLGRDHLREDSDDSRDWSAQNPSLGAQNLVERPANDAFANAVTISSLPFSVDLATHNATKQAGEPIPNCSPAIGRTVWYRFTPAADGFFEFSTIGSNFDTALAIYTGTFAGLAQIACNDDIILGQNPRSRIRINLLGGTTYHIQVGGYNGESGNLRFIAGENIINGNDDIANAVAVGSLPFNYEQDTTEATSDPGDPIPSCNAEAEQSVWFYFNPGVSETLRFETSGSNFDTVLTIYTGTPGNLQEVACHDDLAFIFDLTSRIDIFVGSGTPLYVMVSGGFFGTSGSLKLKVSSLYTPPSLGEPADGAQPATGQPTFNWTAVPGAAGYYLQLGTTNPPTTVPIWVTTTSYTPPYPLLTSRYYWRVRTYVGENRLSAYSPLRSFTIPSEANAVPNHNLYFTARPTLTWNRVSWAANYRIEVDTDTAFLPPLTYQQTVTSNNRELILPTMTDGVYYWRICALAAGETACTSWSQPEMFTVDAP